MDKTRVGKWMAVLLSFVTAAAVLASPASAVEDDGPPPDDGIAERYVVVLQAAPNVIEFGPEGLGTTAAQQRADELVATQDGVANAAGVVAESITHNYTTALNGFAAALTDRQVDLLKATNGVSMILKDDFRQLQTESSTDFINVSGSGEAWSRGVTGEDVIIGVIDSGIWPEHPSLADDGSYSDLGIELDESLYPACDFGNTAHNPDDAPFECNNKLIGARQVLPTYRALVGAEDFEFDSARDDDGHGTHTATTAGGNSGVTATVLGNEIGEVSGVAPRARIIAYKGLGTLGGFSSDLAASIDQAVADGVDVINYSVGGGVSGTLGPDDIAFLNAASANVWVATSAGNSGPGPETIGSPAHLPWMTTVGASTQRRFLEGRVTYGGRTAIGASITGETGRLPIVDAEFAGGELCIPGTLNPAVVAGKIVLCRRGAIARAAKSLAVFQAGGAGMVLYNNTNDDNLITDTHWVPSVHIDYTPGVGLKKWINRVPNPTAKIAGTARAKTWRNAPTMAIFSSRGPNPISQDIIKPDVTAPGVQILAGNTPIPGPGAVPGELFQAIQGTSMSSPHVAGHFALLRQVHPDWSAAAAKSAIMTTASQRVKDNDRRTDADPFSMGSGHIDPGRPQVRGSSFQPGLVYDAGQFDYLGFLCDDYRDAFNDPEGTCAALDDLGFPTTAANLNYPSIAVSEVPGSVTIQRTVTRVAPGRNSIRFSPTIKAPPGYKVEVSPRSLKLNEGESATYQMTITNLRAPLGEWRHGAITWKNGPYEVRSPIAVKGTDLTVPGAVDGEGVDGSGSLPILFGYTGGYEAAAHGLVPATVFEDTVDQDPDQIFDPSDVDAGGANVYEITASGDAALMIDLPPEAVSDPAVIDLDVFVLDETGGLVASSTAGGTFESILIPLPADGTYFVFVHGWATGGTPVDYTLYTWLISATPGGNMNIDSQPAGAVIATTGEVAYSWTGAAAGEWHRGAISHSGDDGLITLTLVDVDNRGID